MIENEVNKIIRKIIVSEVASNEVPYVIIFSVSLRQTIEKEMKCMVQGDRNV